jgi:tetratricopeptide (TPR) repeat protein
LRTVSLALVLAGIAGTASAQGRSSDSGEWYLKAYGEAQPADAFDVELRAEAAAVFARLAAIADRRLNRPPHLLVVGSTSVDARALPDGAVVINLPLLRFCFGRPDAERAIGRARLAFVLGHELAHLANDDAWNNGLFDSPQFDLKREMQSDEGAIRYLLMAGHDPASVVGSGDRNFLQSWARSHHSSSSPKQQWALDARSKALMPTLTRIAASLPSFRFGVRLVQLGRPDDALPLLQHALTDFPGREVESNLGLAYYQRALARLGTCGSREGLRFLLPVALDPQTLAVRAQLRGAARDECPELVAARADLKEAQGQLESALRRYPEYLPARVNLVSVLLQQGDAREAFAKAKEPEAAEPQDPRLALQNALALTGLGRSLMTDAADGALDTLEALESRCGGNDGCGADSQAVAAAAAFDRARLLQERGRASASALAWRRFLTLQPSGPWADEARTTLQQMGEVAGEERVVPPPFQKAALSERLSPEARERLRLAAPRPQVPGSRAAFRSAPNLDALELRGTIEVIEETLEPPLEPSAVAAELGPPARVDTLVGGGTTWIFRDVAYDIEGGRAVRRVLFHPR